MTNTNEPRTYLIVTKKGAKRFQAIHLNGGDPVEHATMIAWAQRYRTGSLVQWWTVNAMNAQQAIALACPRLPDGTFKLPDPMAVAQAAKARLGL